MSGRRLDLDAIAGALKELQREFPRINEHLKSRRDTLSDEIVENMLAGYAAVDTMLAEQRPLFEQGRLKAMLDLNHIVLCGHDPVKREQSAAHIRATEDHFFDDKLGGIRYVVEWYQDHRKDDAWRRAATVYIRGLSRPQLFIEGNHRTGALLMSLILAADGKPPFVLTADSAKAYFDPSSLAKETNKHGIAAMWRIPKLTKYFAKFLEEHSNKDFLTKTKVKIPA